MTVFVCPDDQGRAARVAPVPLVTEEDLALDRHGLELIAMRAELESIPAGE